MRKNNMTDPIQLQQKIIYFKSELAKYKEKVRDYQENYHYSLLENLKEEQVKTHEEKVMLETQLKEIKKEYGQCISAFEAQIKTYEDNKLELEQSQDILQNELSKKNKQCGDLHAKLKDAKREVNCLKTIANEHSRDMDHLQIKNKNLQEIIQKRETEFRTVEDNLRAQLQRLQRMNEKYSSKISTLEMKVKELEQININHKSYTANLEKELKTVNELKSKLEGDYNQRVEYKEKLKDLEINESRLREENKSLSNKIDELSSYIQNEENQYNAVLKKKEDTIKLITNDNLVLKKQIETLRAEIKKIAECEISDENVDEGRDLFYHLDRQLKKLLGQSFHYAEEAGSKKNLVDSLETKIAELQNEIKSIEKSITEQAVHKKY